MQILPDANSVTFGQLSNFSVSPFLPTALLWCRVQRVFRSKLLNINHLG